MNYGKTIKDLREMMGLNQGSFASQLGITQGYLSKIEKGRLVPSMQILEGVSTITKVHLSVLVWLSVGPEDIKSGKFEGFKNLKPIIDSLVKDFMAEVQLPKDL